MASYYVGLYDELPTIASYFGILYGEIYSKIMPYNPDIPSSDFVLSFARIRILFSCRCIDGEYLANRFQYNITSGDNYTVIAQKHFANLTSPEWHASVNSYPPDNIPNGATVNVTVNCSCGDTDVGCFFNIDEPHVLDFLVVSTHTVLDFSEVTHYQPKKTLTLTLSIKLLFTPIVHRSQISEFYLLKI